MDNLPENASQGQGTDLLRIAINIAVIAVVILAALIEATGHG